MVPSTLSAVPVESPSKAVGRWGGVAPESRCGLVVVDEVRSVPQEPHLPQQRVERGESAQQGSWHDPPPGLVPGQAVGLFDNLPRGVHGGVGDMPSPHQCHPDRPAAAEHDMPG